MLQGETATCTTRRQEAMPPCQSEVQVPSPAALSAALAAAAAKGNRATAEARQTYCHGVHHLI